MRENALPDGASNDGARFYPSLDGVRGLAVALVLFHHLVYDSGIDRGFAPDLVVFKLAYSSWLGVDLFFVLSGFLITGILYDAKGIDRYFRTFYGRRTLRIFPLYFGFLVLALFLFPLLLPAGVGEELHATQLWYWLYGANFLIAANGWQGVPLGHLWSLAVEEQFYLLWPLAVWALSRTQLLYLSATCFFTAIALRTGLPFGADYLDAYVLLPMRMDSLAAGAFVALLLRGDQRKLSLGRWPAALLVAAGAGVVAIGLADHSLDITSAPMRTVGYSLIAVACAALIALAVTKSEESAFNRFLSWRALTWLGKYSYGIYVIHAPVIFFLEEAGLQATLFPRLFGSSLPGVLVFCGIGLAISLALAWLSYQYWERPFLRLKRHLPYRNPGERPEDEDLPLSVRHV